MAGRPRHHLLPAGKRGGQLPQVVLVGAQWADSQYRLCRVKVREHLREPDVDARHLPHLLKEVGRDDYLGSEVLGLRPGRDHILRGQREAPT